MTTGPCCECFEPTTTQCVACGGFVCPEHTVLLPSLGGPTTTAYCVSCGPDIERRRAEGTKLTRDLAMLVQETLPGIDPAPALRTIVVARGWLGLNRDWLDREAIAATGKRLAALGVDVRENPNLPEWQMVVVYADETGVILDLLSGEVLVDLQAPPKGVRWAP